ncbi:MAG: hypothetical protein R3282_07905, partial [Rhodothermales bacterium]|nr:hypothetical protein [Rhodothermales bacterium]
MTRTTSRNNCEGRSTSVVAARRILLLTFALCAPIAVTHGQVFPSGPASAGMARGGAAFVYGPEAIFMNPANLALQQHNRVEISTGRAMISAGGDLLQFRFYNDVFTSGETLTDDQVREVLGDWFGGADSGLLRSASAAAE